MARAGTGLLRLSQVGLHLGLPGLSVLPTSSLEEQSRFGEHASSEVRLSLFSGVF